MNIYIAMTPYHVFLSLCFYQYNEDDVILLLDEKNLLSNYSECIKLKNFLYLNLTSKVGLYHKTKLFISFKKRMKKLHADYCLDKVNNVYVFNDRSRYSQKIIEIINCKNVYYIEDGSAPYNDHYVKNSFLKRVIYGFVPGISYELINVFGTSKYIKGSFFTYPELVRVENKTNNINSYLKSSNWRDKIEESHYNLNDFFPLNKSSSRVVLLLLPLLTDEKTKMYFYNLVIEKLKKYDGVYVKYHPLTKSDCNLFNSISNAFVLPSFISSELVMAYNKNIAEVYTTPNTSVFSSSFFFTNVITNVVCDETIKQTYFFKCIDKLSYFNKNINIVWM